ncbi:MAG: methylmalonyl Co-A mutase-associated GTPase MeaB, partial [Candidatus Sericytochromatia bacterium]
MFTPRKRKIHSAQDYIQGILAGDRPMLARAITLIESQLPKHQQMATEIIQALLPHSGQSLRIGISGYPGAGKSTLIEALGLDLLQQGHKLAVLAIDPSSQLSQGSILGDKTRMEALTREQNCFIRPTPSGGNLGGVARHTRETILLCEAAGYDLILIETVGVGQSEVLVRSMVDFFLLVLIPGAGDELQGIKKGVMEMVDAVLVNKADGEHLPQAKRAANEYKMALHYLTPATPSWHPPVLLGSALQKQGLETLWQVILDFNKQQKNLGQWQSRRAAQTLEWFEQALLENLKQRFLLHPSIQDQLPEIRQAVQIQILPVSVAVESVLDLFFSGSDVADSCGWAGSGCVGV